MTLLTSFNRVVRVTDGLCVWVCIVCHCCPLRWNKRTANCVLSKGFAWIFYVSYHVAASPVMLRCVAEWLHSGVRPMKYISRKCRLLSTAHCSHNEQFDCISPSVTSWADWTDVGNETDQLLILNWIVCKTFFGRWKVSLVLKAIRVFSMLYVLTTASFFTGVLQLCATLKEPCLWFC